jgi:hypothetical protein
MSASKLKADGDRTLLENDKEIAQMESVRRLISKEQKPYQLLNGCGWRGAEVRSLLCEKVRGATDRKGQFCRPIPREQYCRSRDTGGRHGGCLAIIGSVP